MQVAGRGGHQGGYLLPNKAISSFPAWGGMRPVPLVYTPSPQFPPCAGGQLRKHGHSLPSTEPLFITWSVTFRAFHLYFMQNGSCEGCKLEGSMGLGPQGGACGVGGSSCTPFFPRGAGLRLVWGVGLLHFCHRHREGSLPTLLPSQLGLYFLRR